MRGLILYAVLVWINCPCFAQSLSQEYLMNRAKYYAYYDYNLKSRVVYKNQSGQTINNADVYQDLSAQQILIGISDSFSVYVVGPAILPRDAVTQVVVAISSNSERLILSDISEMNTVITNLNTKMSNINLSILLCILMDYAPNVRYIYNNVCSLEKILSLPYIQEHDNRNFEYIKNLPKNYKPKGCKHHISVIKYKDQKYSKFLFSYNKEKGTLIKVEQTYNVAK